MMFYISVKVHRFFTSVLPAWQSNQRERNEEVVEHLALSPGDCSPIKTLRNWRWFLWWVFCVEKNFKPTMKMCVPKRRFWLDLDRWTTPGRISLFFSCLGGLTSKLGDAAHACRGHVKLIFRHNSYPSLRLLRDHNCDFHFLQTICARCLSMIFDILVYNFHWKRLRPEASCGSKNSGDIATSLFQWRQFVACIIIWRLK